METLIIIIASIVSVLSTWHLQRITSPDSEKIKRAVRVSGLCALIVVVLAGWNQYQSIVSARNLRSSEIDLDVSENIAGRRISIIDNFFKIYLLSPTISTYTKYNEGLKKASLDQDEKFSYENVTNLSTKKSLQEAREAFENLQFQAKELLDLSIRYPNRVPTTVVEWATLTLNIEFNDLPNHISSYRESPTINRYETLLGTATGSAIKSVISATKNIEK